MLISHTKFTILIIIMKAYIYINRTIVNAILMQVTTERADHSIQPYYIPTPIMKNLIRIIEMECLHLHAPQQQHELLHLVLLVCQ